MFGSLFYQKINILSTQRISSLCSFLPKASYDPNVKKTITTRVFRMVSQLVFNGFILFLGTGTFLYSLFLPSYLIKQKDYIRNFDFIKIDVFLKSLKVHEFFLLFFGKPIILHVFISFNYFFFFSFFFLLL